MNRYIFIIIFLVSTLVSFNGTAQIDLKIGDKLQRKVEDRVNRKVDQGIDKGLDKTEETIEEGVGGDKSSAPADKPENNNASESTSASSGGSAVKGETASLKSYGKFDFVAGERVVSYEDFSQDAIGDFPSLWNTNSGGEVVNVEGREGKYLLISKDGVIYPEFISSLPENFTLEFDLLCNPEFSFYSTGLSLCFSQLNNAQDAFKTWKHYSGDPQNRNGIKVTFHPTSAGNSSGSVSFVSFSKGEEVMNNEASNAQFHAKKKNVARISIWRQKTRIRVYMNEEKVWDLPKAFTAGINYNNLCFSVGGFTNEADRYLIGNLKLAVGAPDTRNKLLTEGKFSTTGILFDSGKDVIRPESYGILKEIGTILAENPTMKIKIVGHTDSDGDETSNLELSKRRAESIKSTLSSEFGIDKSRVATDGKGEKEPVGDNLKPEGKAQNRRVDFIKV